MIAAWLRRLGIRLAPLFRPREDDERRQMKELLASVRRQEKLLDTQREETRRVATQLHQLEQTTTHKLERVDTVLGKTARDIEQWRDQTLQGQRHGHADLGAGIKAIRSNLVRKGAFTASVLERSRRIPRQRFLEQAVLDRLSRVAASNRPIVVGPWTGEVGFELMYWVPFVRWFAGRFGIHPSRMTVLSRGGPTSWYRDFSGSYADVFEYVDAGGFRSATENSLKQRQISEFDRAILKRLVRNRALKRAAVLHPSLMYTLFRNFFAREEGIRHVFAHTAHRRIDPPGQLVPGLPDDYVAVKFYFRSSFPRTPENIAFVRNLLDDVAQRHAIVVLDPGVKVDEHEDMIDPRFVNLSSLRTSTLQDNLDIQTAVIAGARAFIGTYGGFSYLAPLCGVPALAFYDEHLFYLHHRYMADVVFATLNVPSLTMLPTSASALQRRIALDLFAVPSRHS